MGNFHRKSNRRSVTEFLSPIHGPYDDGQKRCAAILAKTHQRYTSQKLFCTELKPEVQFEKNYCFNQNKCFVIFDLTVKYP